MGAAKIQETTVYNFKKKHKHIIGLLLMPYDEKPSLHQRILGLTLTQTKAPKKSHSPTGTLCSTVVW